MISFSNAFAKPRMCFAIACCLLTNPNNGFAQTSNLQTKTTTSAITTAPDFSGTWRLDLSAEQKNQRKLAIENATASLGRFKQSRARQIMQKMTAPPQELKIVDQGNQIRLTRASFELVVGTDNQPITVQTPNGTAMVRAVKRDGSLVIESKTGDSTKTVVYQLSGDGKAMQQQVEILASKLKKPVRFSANYRR